MIRITNQTRSSTIADRGELARSFISRLRGLMGRASLEDGSGLIIYPEWSIHTFFMRFPIDVLFVDRSDRVMTVVAALVPNRPYAGALGARYVIELPVGRIAASGTQAGDQLLLEPSPHR
ncbi:DUF192 domain-containing protein [Candidatus Gracilibacteria bacterium]|nr:DUF192 domain-containing protein [Candidatus Gracilibacteria bacterium]